MNSVVTPTKGRAWLMIAVLSVLIVISAIDRIIISLLIAPLKVDLNLTDTDIGLIFGTTFALFYSLVGLPIARFIDKSHRVILICLGVFLWSVATCASGFVHESTTLALLRAGVAIGEAVLTPATVSLIGDLFRVDRRSLPTSLFSTAAMFGAYGAYVIGAVIIKLFTSLPPLYVPGFGELTVWRSVLLCVGVPGLILAPVFLFVSREPKRRESHVVNPSSMEVARYFFQRWRLYIGLFVGVGINMTVLYAIGTWIVAYLERYFAMPSAQGGLLFGLIGLVSSMGGAMLIPMVAEHLRRSGKKDAQIVIAFFSVIIGLSSSVVAMMQPTGLLTVILLAPSIFCITGALVLVTVSTQFIAPANMQGTFTAILVLSGSGFGLGIGPALAAFLSEHIFHGPNALRTALTVIPLLIAPISLYLLSLARKPYLTALRQFVD